MSPGNERSREAGAAVRHAASARLDSIWWAFLVRGLLALALAACALFWPQRTIGLLVKLLGAYFLIDGVAGAVSAFRARGKGAIPIQAVVSVVAGLVLVFWTESEKLFMVLIGLWAMLQGLSIFWSSRSLDSRDVNRGALAIVGAVVAAVGLVFAFWPRSGAIAISWLIAAGALVVGLLLVFLALRLRQARRRIDALGP